MPYPPDHDTNDADDADDALYRATAPWAAELQVPRPPGWARRARTGSAATAVAALAALGATTVAHASPAQTSQMAPAPVLLGQGTAEAGEHTVTRGDSLWAIAQQHGVEVRELMRWNDLTGAALLLPGRALRLSGEDAPAAGPPEATGPAAPQPAPPDHVVHPGDSLWSIAQAQDVSVQQLLDANDLTVDALLRPGQKLSLPGWRPAAAASAAAPERAVGDSFPGRTYERAVVEAANRHRDQLASRPVPSREEMRRIVHDTAVRMDVDPALAMAHAQQESGFDHRAVSPADAVGTMQVIPDAGEWASGLVGRQLDLLDPQDNVTAGVAIIRQLGRSAPGTDVAIAAYYQGLHGVQRYGMYDDTKKYVNSVKDLLRAFGGDSIGQPPHSDAP